LVICWLDAQFLISDQIELDLACACVFCGVEYETENTEFVQNAK